MRWRLGGIGGVGVGLDGVRFIELLASVVFAVACSLLIEESLCAPLEEEGKDCGADLLFWSDVPKDSPR